VHLCNFIVGARVRSQVSDVHQIRPAGDGSLRVKAGKRCARPGEHSVLSMGIQYTTRPHLLCQHAQACASALQVRGCLPVSVRANSAVVGVVHTHDWHCPTCPCSRLHLINLTTLHSCSFTCNKQSLKIACDWAFLPSHALASSQATHLRTLLLAPHSHSNTSTINHTYRQRPQARAHDQYPRDQAYRLWRWRRREGRASSETQRVS
jgi:hypothetical protein